jgi:F-box and WD-40 domain protein CDC4
MDNSVRVWDVRTGECLAVLSGHTSLVGLINSSGIHVLSAAADGRVNVWNVISGDLQHTLPHPSAVVCLASDEDRAVTASGGTVQMWDISSGVSIWDACVGNQVWNIVWKQGVLIVASRRNNVSMFDLYDFR